MEALKTYFKEIRTIPLLTADEEIELSKRIKKGDEQARKKMIRANLRLVINLAKKYMYLGIPLLDLIEEGNIGLMKAVDKFNYKKGYRFSTYAAWWIKQTISRCICEQGKMIRVPVYLNELIAKWKKTKETLAQSLNYAPSDEEIAKKMRLSKEKREQINFWMTTGTSSLDAPIGEEEESQVMDMLVDTTSPSPDSGISQIINKERVQGLIGLLNRRERKILNMRFGLKRQKPQTLAQIARKLGLSRERVRQIEDEALMKLKKFIRERKGEE